MILRRDFLRMPAGLLGALVAGPVRTPPAGLVLECTLGQDHDRLEVGYVLRNHTAGDIGIFDAAPEVSDACYVDFEDPVLLLGKLVLSVPPGLQTAGRPVPCAARLAKNDVFRDQLSLPVPVAVNNPYRF